MVEIITFPNKNGEAVSGERKGIGPKLPVSTYLWDKLPLSFVHFYIPFKVNYAMNINLLLIKFILRLPEGYEGPILGSYTRHPSPFLPELLDLSAASIYWPLPVFRTSS